MGQGTRQWKALMRKNWITWKRNAGCSFFEICCPAAVMFLMVILRNLVDITVNDYAILSEAKAPLALGLNWDSDATNESDDYYGAWSADDLSTQSANLQDFFLYGSYPAPVDEGYYKLTDNQYYLSTDVRGPLAFLPSNCLKDKSFQLPKVDMPIIAIVGESNQAQWMMQNYIEVLHEFQLDNQEEESDVVYPKFYVKNFATQQELFDWTSSSDYTFEGGNDGVCFGFQIEDTTQTSDKSYKLTLYMNDQTQMGGQNSVNIPSTQTPAYDPLQTTPNTQGFTDYLSRSYGMLHNLAANVILKIESNLDTADISILACPMPAYYDKTDSFTSIINGVLPLLILLIFIPPVYNMVFMIVKEKESRIKESMRMMGMKDRSYWLSWYVYYTCVTSMIVLLAWGVLLINVIGDSNPFLIWLYFTLYAQAIFAQIIFLSALFENSKYSGIVGTLIYFGMNLLGIPAQSATASVGIKIVFSIFPQCAMLLTTTVFGNLEGSGIGLNFGNMTEQIANYSYATGCIMLVISTFLFTLLAFYLEAVLPRTYGEKKPACFCFTFCCRKATVTEEQFDQPQLARRSTLQNAGLDEAALDDPFELKYLEKENYEPVPPEVARLELDDQYLRVEGLTKVYPNGFQAVNGINLKMYNGQIFALLGHNGAGKSTTISMLTGLLARTTGAARIFGDDLFQQMDDVRQYMGVCPQHDVLFDQLTPEEHLDIFYDFKGGDPARKEEELRSLIADVGVAPDKKKQAGSLSGGNRRKLSVAIALCGNSKLVLFDEPTAGMDLSARRSLWDMLKNYRNDRIMILTTHYMDEADILGDRIGIMAKGKVMCLGSSLFLKNRYGAGYKLTMVKKFKKPNRKIQPYLHSVFGSVEKLSEVSQEITFKIDYEQAAQFQSFFEQFDSSMENYDILSYGISMTTLEEVFLKVNEKVEEKTEEVKMGSDEFFEQEPKDKRGSSINRTESHQVKQDTQDEFNEQSLSASQDVSSENLVGNGSLCAAIKALIVKRFNIYKRDKCGLICELVVPVVLVLLGLGLLQIDVLKNSPSFLLEASNDVFPGPQRMLYNQDTVFKTSELDEWTTATADGATFYTPQELAGNLPDPDYFDVTYTSQLTYAEFYDQLSVVASAEDNAPEPYRFGSFEIYNAINSYTNANGNNLSQNFQVNMFVNTTSAMSVPYFTQYMYQSILTTAKSDIVFNTETAPFPVFAVFETRVASGQAIDFAVIVSIALALIPCVVISYIIKEREQQLKHMQVISGVSLPAYWASNLISDIFKTYIPIIVILILTAIFKLQYDGVWELFLLYPLAIVPFTYVTSFFFTSDTVAQIITLFLHFLMGGIAPIVVFSLQNIKSTANLGDSMRWWFTPIPTFCVSQGIIFSSTKEALIATRAVYIENNPDMDLNQIDPDTFAFQNLTGNYTIMLASSVVFVLLLVLIEADIFQSCSKFSIKRLPERQHDLDLDDDVIAEEERLSLQSLHRGVENRTEQNAPFLDPENLQKGDSEMDVVRVYNFRKAYTTLLGDPFLAVEKVSFGLEYGECFALLGVNGAGKSTTFKSLTRDITATSGDITIAGHNVMTEFGEARKLIGYCPQHDAVFPLMTVEEHLVFYSNIKGIPMDKRESVIEDAITQLNLADHRTKPAGTLSGGNKRKLSVAMAIIGNPPIILLDEPSAGMDPEARRFMWSVVEKISQRDKKSAVILTTHSMEEAEALSTKMAIMVRGGIFRCYGSSQHIKNKFATGYEIEIKIRKTNFSELDQMKTEWNLEGDLTSKIDLQIAKEILQSTDLDHLMIDQICVGGLGSDLAQEADLNENKVRLSALVRYCFVQHNGLQLLHDLASLFPQIELMEQCGDFYKLRVPRDDKSIGFLFGKIESLKESRNIQEYGVCQTSLEQIFQTFANQNINEKAALVFKLNPLDQLMLMNPDRKVTLAQKRMSLVGRKSIKNLPELPTSPSNHAVQDKDERSRLL